MSEREPFVKHIYPMKRYLPITKAWRCGNGSLKKVTRKPDCNKKNIAIISQESSDVQTAENSSLNSGAERNSSLRGLDSNLETSVNQLTLEQALDVLFPDDSEGSIEDKSCSIKNEAPVVSEGHKTYGEQLIQREQLACGSHLSLSCTPPVQTAYSAFNPKLFSMHSESNDDDHRQNDALCEVHNQRYQLVKRHELNEAFPHHTDNSALLHTFNISSSGKRFDERENSGSLPCDNHDICSPQSTKYFDEIINDCFSNAHDNLDSSLFDNDYSWLNEFCEDNCEIGTSAITLPPYKVPDTRQDDIPHDGEIICESETSHRLGDGDYHSVTNQNRTITPNSTCDISKSIDQMAKTVHDTPPKSSKSMTMKEAPDEESDDDPDTSGSLNYSCRKLITNSIDKNQDIFINDFQKYNISHSKKRSTMSEREAVVKHIYPMKRYLPITKEWRCGNDSPKKVTTKPDYNNKNISSKTYRKNFNKRLNLTDPAKKCHQFGPSTSGLRNTLATGVKLGIRREKTAKNVKSRANAQSKRAKILNAVASHPDQSILSKKRSIEKRANKRKQVCLQSQSKVLENAVRKQSEQDINENLCKQYVEGKGGSVQSTPISTHHTTKPRTRSTSLLHQKAQSQTFKIPHRHNEQVSAKIKGKKNIARHMVSSNQRNKYKKGLSKKQRKGTEKSKGSPNQDGVCQSTNCLDANNNARGEPEHFHAKDGKETEQKTKISKESRAKQTKPCDNDSECLHYIATSDDEQTMRNKNRKVESPIRKSPLKPKTILENKRLTEVRTISSKVTEEPQTSPKPSARRSSRSQSVDRLLPKRNASARKLDAKPTNGCQLRSKSITGLLPPLGGNTKRDISNRTARNQKTQSKCSTSSRNIEQANRLENDEGKNAKGGLNRFIFDRLSSSNGDQNPQARGIDRQKLSRWSNQLLRSAQFEHAPQKSTECEKKKVENSEKGRGVSPERLQLPKVNASVGMRKARKKSPPMVEECCTTSDSHNGSGYLGCSNTQSRKPPLNRTSSKQIHNGKRFLQELSERQTKQKGSATVGSHEHPSSGNDVFNSLDTTTDISPDIIRKNKLKKCGSECKNSKENNYEHTDETDSHLEGSEADANSGTMSYDEQKESNKESTSHEQSDSNNCEASHTEDINERRKAAMRIKVMPYTKKDIKIDTEANTSSPIDGQCKNESPEINISASATQSYFESLDHNSVSIDRRYITLPKIDSQRECQTIHDKPKTSESDAFTNINALDVKFPRMAKDKNSNVYGDSPIHGNHGENSILDVKGDSHEDAECEAYWSEGLKSLEELKKQAERDFQSMLKFPYIVNSQVQRVCTNVNQIAGEDLVEAETFQLQNFDSDVEDVENILGHHNIEENPNIQERERHICQQNDDKKIEKQQHKRKNSNPEIQCTSSYLGTDLKTNYTKATPLSKEENDNSIPEGVSGSTSPQESAVKDDCEVILTKTRPPDHPIDQQSNQTNNQVNVELIHQSDAGMRQDEDEKGVVDIPWYLLAKETAPLHHMAYRPRLSPIPEEDTSSSTITQPDNETSGLKKGTEE